MLTRDFDYDLPERLIARHPPAHREDARLLCLQKETGQISHRCFRDLPNLLSSNDLLVLNNTRVFPARLLGTRPPDYGKIEALLLHPEDANRWWAMVRPGKKIKKGDRLVFAPGHLEAEVEAYGEKGGGERLLRFDYRGDWWQTLEQFGHTPLPPYILRARKNDAAKTLPSPLLQPEDPEDRERYQTVFAGKSRESVAAPTAGLHFSTEILDQLEQRGIERVFLHLSVAAGTFRPIQTDRVEEHPMHEEHFEIPAETAARLNQAVSEGRRIVCVGTTVVRALETAAQVARDPEGTKTPFFRPDTAADSPMSTQSAQAGAIRPLSGWTRLLILPGFPFQMTGALLTNFHLPRSTLLLLVSALAGWKNIRHAYQEAIEKQYRFYSYGDCTFIE